MRTPPQRLIGILEAVQFEGHLVLRSPDLREQCGKLDWREAYSAAHRGEIEGVGSSGNPIKYFRLLADHERPEMPAMRGVPVYKTREPIGAALQPYYEDQIGQYQVGTLCRVTKGGQLLKWSDEARFPEGRFNPDRIPAPLMAYLPCPTTRTT